ncbi:hypothetical protein [Ralstonia holmesii]|uniref:hypothetical protein n=1 Tax=Ralstonia holmesii TaxID=3058602 RepID=UPI0028F4EC5C|nr:hypothetical protein [Ralstonia sp. LMG 32967]CAJ0698612.1 hypothetical protein R11007_02841 [Ralstonia sp. LMG 32967]
MMRRLLLAYSNTRPVKVISDNGRRYLERYFVCSAFGMRVYLHRFVASDPDRGLHDHPWRWAASIILAGSYWEQTRAHDPVRCVRWLNFLTGNTFHRVLIPPGMDVWTLFIVPARDVKEWGFLRDKGQMGQIFTPYNYGAAGKPARWWEHAPKGKEIR